MARYLRAHPTIDAWGIPGYLQAMYKVPQPQALALYADNRAAFRRIFGAPSGHYRGEFLYHCWVFPDGYCLSSAATKGTRIEVPPGATPEGAMAFKRMVMEKLRKSKERP